MPAPDAPNTLAATTIALPSGQQVRLGDLGEVVEGNLVGRQPCGSSGVPVDAKPGVRLLTQGQRARVVPRAGTHVRLALEGLPVRVHDVVAGLGGRAITKRSLRAMLEDGLSGDLSSFTFLDLDWDLVRREEQRWLGSL